MKKISYLLFMLILPAFMLMGCSDDDDNGDKQIEMPNQSEQIQRGYADDETTGGFTFTSKSTWTATVIETTSTNRSATLATKASSVSWLRLLLDRTETYNGGAGTFTLTIELDANYTGETRSATITIKSGNDSITITVTQDGTAEDGKVPEEPSGIQKQRISKIVCTSTENSVIHTIEFSYDSQSRLSAVRNTNYDGEGTQENISYVYDGNQFKGVNLTYRNSKGKGGKGSEEVELNRDGNVVNIYSSYTDNNDHFKDEYLFDIEYQNGFLYKLSGYDEIVGGGIENNTVSTCEWEEVQGNMTKITTIFEDNTIPDVQRLEYGAFDNNFTIDINYLVSELYIPGFTNMMSGAVKGIWGKSCRSLVSKYTSTGPVLGSATVIFDYTFEKEKLTKATATSNDGQVDTYVFFYE